LSVCSDRDWVGCKTTRKSCSGGVILLLGGLVTSWSNRQASGAFSSGEAEYCAVVKAGAEAFGVHTLAKDLGWVASIRLFVDSSAAKVRHLEVRFFWMRDGV
jgi:hypothetical protein